MTQAGGPAAINGFLNQIIHHLGWLADVTLSGKLAGREIKDACLVLEPRNGGDARAEASGIYLVEQYKTRAGGTWALADVPSVLRDLRKAVPPSRPANARYRFVTDGLPGKLEVFEVFLTDLKSVAGPDDLDNDEKRNFGRTLSVTNREFFDHIVVATRSRGLQASPEERTVVFHLLSHFEMEFGASGSARAEAVERLLRQYAPDLGDERRVREQLVGVLMEKLSKGETRLGTAELDAIFRHAGLNPERLRKLARLAETMGALTRQRLARLRYRRETDVRGVPDWPEDKPVSLITGKSGVGKTWQLGRLLEAYEEASQIAATLVPAGRGTEDILTRASRDAWQSGLGETSDKSLRAVSHFVREIAPDIPMPWLTVAVDDIQDVDLARDLVRQDWADWGTRLVLTVPLTVAQALQLTDGEALHVHHVSDFSVYELDALLKQHGQRWSDLPSDLKKLLRSPILAGLFLDLPYASFQSAPRSEYEIFERFWQRITARGRPGDEGIVMALAAHMYEGKPYPLPRPAWHEIGLTDDGQLVRLEAAGWLQSVDGGEVAFDHERLLNWAVAKSFGRKFQRRELSVENLGALLTSESDGQGRQSIRRLGYVPMDTLWLLAAEEENSEKLGQLIAQLEDSRRFGSYGEELYVRLLPTLGQRAVPLLLERLRAITSSSDGDYRVGLIDKAFAGLALQEGVELEEAVDALLNSPSRDRQAVAIAALTAAPSARHLDRLWELHQQRLDALEDKADVSRHRDYQASFAALRAGSKLAPEWLRHRISASDAEREPVSELAYLLNGLEHRDAPAIWQATSNILMVKVSARKPRSLLYCIARFSDREKLDFVAKHLSRSEDFASGAALAALAVLDPVMAIDRLVEVEDAERSLTRNQWLPVLLRAQPDLTRRRVREFAETDAKGRRLIEVLFWERPDELDEDMLRFLLRALETDLREHFDTALAGDPIWLFHSLDFLGRIAHPDLLAVLEAEAGGELEHMITAVACSRLRNNSINRDHVRENARRVLILMGGEGVTTLINRELESEHIWIRLGGLNWAFVRADAGTIERLAAIARRPVPRDGNGKPESHPYREFYQAMTALAALGADAILVEMLGNSDMAEVPVNLAALRAYQGPMPKALTKPALRILESADSAEDALVVALAIAWLSGDAALIPAVRAVFEQVEPESLTARYACITLQELGDRSDDFARLAMRLAQTEANVTWGMNALIGLRDRGVERLGNWLRNRSATECTKHDVQAIRALYNYPETRELAVDAAVDRCRRERFILDAPYDIAAEADEPILRERILDKAFAGRSFGTALPLRAIKGLAKFDITRAIEAIELGLLLHPKMERDLCRLLVRIAPETAAIKLIDAATSIERDSLRRAAGRALRRLDPTVVEPLVIGRMSGSSSARKAVAELAGWLPMPTIAETLSHLADHDSAREVRYAALAALDHHRREATTRALLAAFPSATPARRWTLLVALLELADPHLLTDREDSLWLGQILTDDVPAAFAYHAESVLQQRRQKNNA